jgi:hypothetical protein
MMGASSAVRAVRFGVLLACSIFLVGLVAPSPARANPPSGYACPPGVPEKGVGCTCPKGYASKRDDSNIAVCSPQKIPTTPKLTYEQLLTQANSYADTDCVKAEAWYAKALAAKPKGIEALVGSGMCFVELRKWTNAHSRFRSALSIDARYEGALWGVAETYRLQGKRDDAIAAYRQYLDIYPSSYKAKAALEKLAGNQVERVDRPDPVVTRPGKFPARTSDIRIAIDGTRITINGSALAGAPMMSDVIAILGQPDRVWNVNDAVNQVHTWDRLGVIAYEPMDGRCISLTMPFRPMKMDYDPATNFAGTISVDGQPLTGSTDLSVVRGRAGATQPYGSGSVVFAKGEFNVFMNSKSGAGPIDLVELSMWKKATVPVAATGKATRTGDMKIAVSGTRVTMNGVDIKGKPMLADFEAVYGKPDRVWDQNTGNRVHTWDRLGLVAYEPRDGRVISATFPFKPMGAAYDPKTMFGGSIIVDGLAMGPSHDIDTIKTRRGATQPYTKASIVFDKGDIHVFTIGKGAGARLDLVEISFWQRDKTGPTTTKSSAPTNTADVSVVVQGTSVVMNGKAISGKPMVADLEAVFGKADRVWETKGGVNRIHTWDKLGLLVYEPYDGRCISATFPYKPFGSAFDPKTMFGGSVVVDGNRMTSVTTLGTVKQRPGATTPYGANSIVFDKGDLHVFTQADSDATAIELVEISFWQKDRK